MPPCVSLCLLVSPHLISPPYLFPKVQNKLDSRVYAVKMITLPELDLATVNALALGAVFDGEQPLELNQKILREVLTLSRLQHRHVVRYYQAWVEGMDKTRALRVSGAAAAAAMSPSVVAAAAAATATANAARGGGVGQGGPRFWISVGRGL